MLCILGILTNLSYLHIVMILKVTSRGSEPPVAKWLRALFLIHLIISPLCLVWVRAPLWPLETSQVLLAGVPGGFSLESPVVAHLLIDPSHMS